MEKHTVSCEDVGYEKIPRYSLDDVKLKNDIKDKVTFFLSNFRENALDNLGAHQTIKNGKGLVFLFHGPPGTGKSMLAEAIAAYLNKKMLIVEFPKITSRWLGVTEKNISKIFRSARENDMLLCIDEADTLLYSRTYAVHEHDIRFVNVMLQELERFEGVAVLTTNMDMLLDQALERRVTLKIKFEEPSEELRSGIWKNHIPQTVSISRDVDFTALAKKYDFSGGYIKNAVLNALRRISLNKQSILTMEDLVFGANIEKEGAFNQKKKQAILGFAMQ
ncbi:MAG: ATP-binding protein [Candidatus Omnitrophica bacterium]|nr:ATP-binding protein [Candidatus Omnitrophota bacterium]